MTDHTPITGEELEAMKRRCEQVRTARTPQDTFPHINLLLEQDIPRCLTEVERLRAENDALRTETARIILQAEEHPDQDGQTFTLKFTRQLLAELRALLT